jgi:hypothetical protein
MAPDKIYIDKRDAEEEMAGIVGMSFTTPRYSDRNYVEYIRKDALIEWADSERTNCINAFFFDEADLYNNLIDKLNSL